MGRKFMTSTTIHRIKEATKNLALSTEATLRTIIDHGYIYRGLTFIALTVSVVGAILAVFPVLLVVGGITLAARFDREQ